VTYQPGDQRAILTAGRFLLEKGRAPEDLVKRCCLPLVLLSFFAVSLRAEPVPTGKSLDDVFLWLAGGISSARLQRLTGATEGTGALGCRVTLPCMHALRLAGADEDLIHSLFPQSGGQGTTPKTRTTGQKTSTVAACRFSESAATIAGLVHADKLTAAEDHVRAALRDDPGNASLLFVLGTILRRQERTDEALDAFMEAEHRRPGFPETHNQISYLFYRTDDSDNALAEARTALSMDPANAEAYRYLGLALYAGGHYEAALNAFEKSLERESDNADVYFDIGITQRDKGNLRQSAIAYRHALTLRPDFWQAHSNLGVVLRDQGKLDEAAAEYRTAIRLKPDEASVRNNLGNTLCDKEDFDGAIAEFKELYRQTPEWEGGHNCLARAYMSKRDYAGAIRELRAAIAANPAGAAEHRVLGQALLLTGKDAEAVDVLRKAVALNPDSGVAHHYLGTAFVNTQAMAEAEKEFREALRLEPNAQNHYSLAACLMALNRFEEALGELEIASRLDPKESLYRARMQEAARMITSSK
jgi:tetratricopeptide (TPR) repeat protein